MQSPIFLGTRKYWLYGPFAQKRLQLLWQQMHLLQFHSSGDHAVETQRAMSKLYSVFSKEGEIPSSSFHTAKVFERGTNFNISFRGGCWMFCILGDNRKQQNIQHFAGGDGDATVVLWGCLSPWVQRVRNCMKASLCLFTFRNLLTTVLTESPNSLEGERGASSRNTLSLSLMPVRLSHRCLCGD